LIADNYKKSNVNIELEKTLKKYNNHFYKPPAGLPSARKNYNPKYKFY
jgi:hypothetical protein